MSDLSKFISFLNKYSDEVQGVSFALRTIVTAIPFNKQDRVKVLEVLDALDSVPDNIAKAVGELKKQPKIVIRFDDIKAAVSSLLPDVVAKFFSDKAKEESKKQDDGK